jgi:uncharacterized protein YggE
MSTKRWVSLLVVVGLAVGPARAFAQVRPAGAAAAGIAVAGTGTVRRPADAVRYTIVLSGRNVTASGSILSSAAALVDALKRNGSADAVLADPPNAMISQQSTASVRGSLRKPSAESVRAFVAAVTATLPPDGVPIQSIGYVNVLDDCSEAERVAQNAAFEEARRRAAGIAAAAHVTLGGVTAVTEGITAPNACPTRPDPAVAAGFTGPYASPDAFNVLVTVTLNVTFAIAGRG